ncbi:MAG: hypothetical protein GY874_09135 [Desulfobacteraceae bacterium]|nr:hypothetical protein [Desulfobacteraceae bacterium]
MKLKFCIIGLFLCSTLFVHTSALAVSWDEEDGTPWSQTTDVGPDAQVPGFFVNLGMTGARAKLSESNLKALFIEYVFPDSPAAGKLEAGDQITGANGKAFETEHKNGWGPENFGGEGPLMDFGNALEQSYGSNGILTLTVQRGGSTETVEIDVGTEYGAYSDEFPYNCPKADRQREELCAFVASKQESDGTWKGQQTTFIAALALLASGNPEYLPLVKKAAENFAQQTVAEPSIQEGGLRTWRYTFTGIMLAEYYLATGEEWVKKELQEIKTWLTAAQLTNENQLINDNTGLMDRFGGWGHKAFMSGYGPFSMLTAQALTALSLIERCGIEVDKTVLENGYKFLADATNQAGYVWYRNKVASEDRWGDIGRTGASAVAHYLSPISNSVADLHAGFIGVDNHYKSFPDTHGNCILGMSWVAMGAAYNPESFSTLMNYHRYWFALAQTHDGNQFVSQPSRGGKYDSDPRVFLSATMALMFYIKDQTLQMTGAGDGNSTVYPDEEEQPVEDPAEKSSEGHDQESSQDGLRASDATIVEWLNEQLSTYYISLPF